MPPRRRPRSRAARCAAAPERGAATRFGSRDAREDARDDVVGGQPFDLGLRAHDHTVREDERRDVLDVVGGRERAPVEVRRGLRAGDERQRRARARTERDVSRRARRGDHVVDVCLQRLARRARARTARCAASDLRAARNRRRRRRRRDRARRIRQRRARSARVSSAGGGYPVRTRTKNRSSCASGSGYVPSYSIGFCVAHTKNGCGSACVVPSIVTLPLFHRFEERGLRLRRRAIDLVGEQQVREDGALAQRERRAALIEHRRSDDVGRHQIRRELDPP